MIRKTDIIDKKPEYFKKRLSGLRKIMEKKAVDGYIICKAENIYYLTGFYAKDSGAVLLIFADSIYLIAHFIFFEQAKNSVCLDDLEIIKFISDRKEKIAEIISSIPSKTIAIEGSNTTYDNYKNFSNILKKNDKKIKNISGVIEELRSIKDKMEIENIEKSCVIMDRVLKFLLESSFADLSSLSEIGLAMKIENKMIELGSSGKAFELIVAGNKVSSIPHHQSGQDLLKEGILLMDLGCVLDHYCSDITRTVFLDRDRSGGPVSLNRKEVSKLKEIYDIVLQAQMTALDFCRSGVECWEVDNVARKIISDSGYEDNFGHGLGHGVGLEVHEMPTVSLKEKKLLQDNMVVTIEPGIYIEGLGGVRIEDMVIVQKNGCRNLYKTPKTLTIIR